MTRFLRVPMLADAKRFAPRISVYHSEPRLFLCVLTKKICKLAKVYFGSSGAHETL